MSAIELHGIFGPDIDNRMAQVIEIHTADFMSPLELDGGFAMVSDVPPLISAAVFYVA
jgi:hypothetical protein